MKVKIQYFASVRELVDRREEVMEVPLGTTVKGLLDVLVATHGEKLKEYLFNNTGSPRPHLQFILDEKPITETGGYSTVLTDGCALAVIPPVGGG